MSDAILKNVPGMETAHAVPEERAEALGEQEFVERYVNVSRPCVIRGAVAHWPAVQNWRSAQYLKERCGHYPVLFFPHENHITLERMLAGKRQILFREAMDLLHSDETGVASLGLTQDLVELRADIGRFSFLTRAEPSFIFPPIRYFIYRNAGSAWHYHPLDETLMCQFVGSKRVGLLRVEAATFASAKSLFLSEKYFDGRVERDGGPPWQYGEAHVEPGDALYIPPLWWHGVVTKSGGFGMTAAIPWRSPPHVIAESLRKMARGEGELMGSATEAQIQSLIAAAGSLGVEKELARAWTLPVPSGGEQTSANRPI